MSRNSKVGTAAPSQVVEAVVVTNDGSYGLAGKLRELQQAKEQGLLSQNEFEESKKKIIDTFTGKGAVSAKVAKPVHSSSAAVTSQPVARETFAEQTWTASYGKISAEDISGDYCCLCCMPPFGWGCTRIYADGPDKIHQMGCCTLTAVGPLCCGGEIRNRRTNTNDFVHFKDPKNVTTFKSSSCATNGPSCLCRCSSMKYKFQKIKTKDIEGKWCCFCLGTHCLGSAFFSKRADGENELTQMGCCCFNGIPAPFNERRIRYEGSNGFYKADDPDNIDWYWNPGCVNNGLSCSRKC